MSRLDKYRKAFDKSKGEQTRDLGKLHRQIATEAARRLAVILESDRGKREPVSADFHAAKMQAVAVLGLVVRPGELPPDSLVREIYENETEVSAKEELNVAQHTEPETADLQAGSTYADRFDHFLSLLKMLERVKQDPKTHPEGDALYHSLQVFDLVLNKNPYDEELLTAALLHDVGKATDPFSDSYAASVKALHGRITPRTARMIERLPAAKAQLAGALGYRARRALDRDEDSEALALLAEADREGRKSGVEVPTPEEAVETLRQLSEGFAIDSELENS